MMSIETKNQHDQYRQARRRPSTPGGEREADGSEWWPRRSPLAPLTALASPPVIGGRAAGRGGGGDGRKVLVRVGAGE